MLGFTSANYVVLLHFGAFLRKSNNTSCCGYFYGQHFQEICPPVLLSETLIVSLSVFLQRIVTFLAY